MFFICSRSWQFSWKYYLLLSLFSLSHSISLSSDLSSGCFVTSEAGGSGREGKRSSIVSLHGSPRAWVYGFGHCWSLHIQLLLAAQSSSFSFLLKSFHLAGLARKFPIIWKLLLGRGLRIYWFCYWNLVWKLTFPLVRRNLFSFSGGFLILFIPLDT
jgi:hypothetical protein